MKNYLRMKPGFSKELVTIQHIKIPQNLLILAHSGTQKSSFHLQAVNAHQLGMLAMFTLLFLTLNQSICHKIHS